MAVNLLDYNAPEKRINLVACKLSVKFQRRFSQNSLVICTDTLRIEYFKGVQLSHEVSSTREFPMSCRLLVSEKDA